MKEKEQSKEKASSTSLGICTCADSVQDDLHFPACRDRGGYLSWMGTEPASSGRLHCSSCFYETWTLATDVSISADPGACTQCETMYPYAALNLPLASTFCISYFHFKPCGVCLRESATLLSDPGKFFLPWAASCCRECVNIASGVAAGGNIFPIVLKLLISYQNSDNY